MHASPLVEKPRRRSQWSEGAFFAAPLEWNGVADASYQGPPFSKSSTRRAKMDRSGGDDRQVRWRGSQADFLRVFGNPGIGGVGGGEGDGGPVAGDLGEPAVGPVFPGVLVEFLAPAEERPVLAGIFSAGVTKRRAGWRFAWW